MWLRRRRTQYQIPRPIKASNTIAPMIPPAIGPAWDAFEESDNVAGLEVDDGGDIVLVKVGLSGESAWVAVDDAELSEVELDVAGATELETLGLVIVDVCQTQQATGWLRKSSTSMTELIRAVALASIIAIAHDGMPAELMHPGGGFARIVDPTARALLDNSPMNHYERKHVKLKNPSLGVQA
ncbi:hypothetical protein B0H19DRAFT_1084752 [Mycena capillaripes]|nr:hypothetical protein B0H19DRAFT_1084752 [Mycena capillaripes]